MAKGIYKKRNQLLLVARQGNLWPRNMSCFTKIGVCYWGEKHVDKNDGDYQSKEYLWILLDVCFLRSYYEIKMGGRHIPSREKYWRMLSKETTSLSTNYRKLLSWFDYSDLIWLLTSSMSSEHTKELNKKIKRRIYEEI